MNFIDNWTYRQCRRHQKDFDDLFCVAWWCGLRSLDNYDEWVVYLQQIGWDIPKWLDDKLVANMVKPVMYAHYSLTTKAIAVLFCYWRCIHSQGSLDLVYLTFDEAYLFSAIADALAARYSFYQIACALYEAARTWDGFENKLYRKFASKNLCYGASWYSAWIR